jgi:hypothetical protein
MSSSCFNRRSKLILNVTVLKINVVTIQLNTGKPNAIPLKAWTGPEGFRRLRRPDFKTVGT